MSIIALIDFSFCLWAVFSRHFCDGIITKHFLTFSAITAMLVVLDPANHNALAASLVLLACGIAYWFIRHFQKICDYFINYPF